MAAMRNTVYCILLTACILSLHAPGKPQRMRGRMLDTLLHAIRRSHNTHIPPPFPERTWTEMSLRSILTHSKATQMPSSTSLAPTGAAAKVPTARPQTSGRGGILGQIPINYAVARQRTGWYYLPKVRDW